MQRLAPLPITITIEVNNQTLLALYDAGAQSSLLSRQITRLCNVNKLINHNDFLLSAFGKREPIAGRATVSAKIGVLRRTVDLDVVDNIGYDAIVGLDLIRAFRLEQTHNLRIFQNLANRRYGPRRIQVQQQRSPATLNRTIWATSKPIETNITSLINKYSHVFSKSSYDVGQFKHDECRIRLLDDTPINLRCRPLSYKDSRIIKEMTDQLLQAGIISESNSSYAVPVVLANKKDEGEKTRLCMDYRLLNQITQTESYPYPLAQELIDRTRGCDHFTVLDVPSAYFHIRVAQEDKAKTAFITPWGKFEWNVMPFGLKNAPAIFQRALHQLLLRHKLDQFVVNYMDDLLIFSKGLDQHMEHIETVLKTFALENIKLKLSKCQFIKSQVDYLGHTLSFNSVKPLRSNVEAIMAIQAPTNVKEVQSFVGHIQYYREFVSNCSALLSPITELLKKDKVFEWGPDQEHAFQTVRKLLAEPPVLAIFDPDKPIHLFTDASTKGIGAILKQPDGHVLRPVSYFSRSLQPYQKNYAVAELECLAIVEAFKHWHHYLDGHKTMVHSDHKGLQWLHKIGLDKSRLARWSMQLSQYDYKVVYEPGKSNVEADTLSRNPISINAYFLDDTRIENQISCANQTLINSNNVPSGCQVTNGQITYQDKLFVPPSLTSELVYHVHRDCGHLSSNRLFPHIHNRYRWPHMRDDIERITKGCLFCAKNKSRPTNQLGLFRATEVTEPFQIIQIDSVGGLEQGNVAKRYLHLAIDMMSRKVWHVCSRTQKTEDFINLMNKVLCDNTPQCVRSDNYPALNSKRFMDYLQRHNIHYEHSPPYTPQAVGIVERVNGTLVNHIRATVNDSSLRVKWPKAAEKIVQIYNQTIHSSTKSKPDQASITTNPDELESISHASKIVSDRNLDRINRSRQPMTYQPGQEVMVKNESLPNRKKLAELYRGPATVIDQLSDSLVKVNMNGRVTTHSIRSIKPA